MKTCFVSIDVEHDASTQGAKTFQGIDSVGRILDIFEKFNIPTTLFVTGDVLEKYGDKVKEWAKKYEIASHSFSHIYFNELSDFSKEEDIKKFIAIYGRILGARPLGFRAPSHVIDEYTFGLLAQYGFTYDSSVVPHYPYFKMYRGYGGIAPTVPYIPQPHNIRKREAMGGKGRILEIPVSGQILGIPLAGAWIRKLPIPLYKILFVLYKPDFITLSMHSWDALDARFLPKLIKILEILRNSGYVFKSGEQIATELSSGAMEKPVG